MIHHSLIGLSKKRNGIPRRPVLRNQEKIHFFVVFLVAFVLIPMTTIGNLFAQEKNNGDISVTFGAVSDRANLPSSIGMVKSLSWRPFGKWISVGANIGILQEVLPIMAHLTLNIPLKWIELYATGGLGFILQNLSSAKNYGGGVKIKVTRTAALVVEYRKITISKTTGLNKRYSLDLDYIGAGIAYYF